MSTKAYNGGLIIADFAAMAYGCAVWPAYWTVGLPWPMGGEIDIVEGVDLKPQFVFCSWPFSSCCYGSHLSPGTNTLCTRAQVRTAFS